MEELTTIHRLLTEILKIMRKADQTNHSQGIKRAILIIDDNKTNEINRLKEVRRYLRHLLSTGAGSINDLMFGSTDPIKHKRIYPLNKIFFEKMSELKDLIS